MTPKFDHFFKTFLEDLSNQGTGGLANRGGGSAAPSTGSSMSTPKAQSTAPKAASGAANISGSNTAPQGGQQVDFNQLLADPDDNKAADAVIGHLTQNNINVSDPNFAKTPEGQAIGQRIIQSPKFADAMNQAQERIAQQATQKTQQTFAVK